MNMKRVLLYFTLLLFLVSSKADKPAYRIFNAKGKAVKYAALLEEAKKSDVIFFGEMHDSPICHWLELELAKDLFQFSGITNIYFLENISWPKVRCNTFQIFRITRIRQFVQIDYSAGKSCII